MSEKVVAKHRVSKFRIGDLALASALELERARTNGAFTATPLLELAEALKQTSLGAESGVIAAMHPGYFEPFDRLNRSRHSGAYNTLEGVPGLVTWAITALGEVAQTNGKGEAVAELLNFCFQLHQEFVGRPAAEARFARARGTFPSEAGIR